MSRRGNDPKLRDLARQLGLDSRGDCAKRLRRYAVDRVQQLTEALPVSSAPKLLEMVAGVLSIKIVVIRQNSDIDGMVARHEKTWPGLGPQLRAEFLDGDTLGLLVAHPSPATESHRFFAFVDARGDREVMAYFTAWHEIAHMLLQPTQLAFDGFRRVTLPQPTEKDVVEALVDEVAGELAFYAPFTGPELEKELEDVGRLTLDGVNRIRDAVAPEGSFLAAAHALVRLAPRPTAFLVAETALKPTEARRARSGQRSLFDGESAPSPKLRVKTAFPNDLAKEAGFKIFRYMRVPPGSVIADAHNGATIGNTVCDENQHDWESGGQHLPALGLTVEAARFGPVTYAVVTCRPSE